MGGSLGAARRSAGPGRGKVWLGRSVEGSSDLGGSVWRGLGRESGVGRPGTGKSEVGVRRGEAPGWKFDVGRPGDSLWEVSVVGRPGPPDERRTVGPGTGSLESVSARWSRRRAPGQWV